MAPASYDEESPSRRASSADRTPACATAREIFTEDQAHRRAAIDAMLALRDSGEIKPVSREDILAWRHEGHRC